MHSKFVVNVLENKFFQFAQGVARILSSKSQGQNTSLKYLNVKVFILHGHSHFNRLVSCQVTYPTKFVSA